MTNRIADEDMDQLAQAVDSSLRDITSGSEVGFILMVVQPTEEDPAITCLQYVSSIQEKDVIGVLTEMIDGNVKH